jgi:hypothetical protein
VFLSFTLTHAVPDAFFMFLLSFMSLPNVRARFQPTFHTVLVRYVLACFPVPCPPAAEELLLAPAPPTVISSRPPPLLPMNLPRCAAPAAPPLRRSHLLPLPTIHAFSVCLFLFVRVFPVPSVYFRSPCRFLFLSVCFCRPFTCPYTRANEVVVCHYLPELYYIA